MNAKYLRVNNEFYKIENITNNICKCYQIDGYNEDLTEKRLYYTFDLTQNKYELWQ